MDEKLSKLIDSLTELVEKLDDVTTAIAAGTEDFDPTAAGDPDAFRDRKKDKQEQNDNLAEKIGNIFKKPTEKKEPRKILQKVMPVSVVNFDQKALAQLQTIVPNSTADLQNKPEADKPDDTFGFLKNIGLGAIALLFAPLVAFVTAIKTIGQQPWFLKLKDFIKNSKIGKMIGSVFGSIKNSFTSLLQKFPKISGMIQKLFGGKTGVLTKVFGKISTVSKTIFGLVKDSKIISIAGKVGKLVGKLFLPITIVWGAIQTVMGAIEGYEQDGVAGAIKGGVFALFDFLVVDLVNLLAKIPIWILEQLGMDNMAASLADNIDGLLTSIKDMFGGVVDLVVGLFTLDTEKMKQGFTSLLGGYIDMHAYIYGMFIDPVVNFLKDIFQFGDPGKPFSFKQDVIDPAVEAIKTWFKNLVALGNTGDGDWSLEKFINEVEKKVIEFFTGIFEWGRSDDGSWSLSAFVSTAFTKAKNWITGLFDWEKISQSITESSTWLKDAVMGAWNSIKEWVTGLLTWAEPSEEDGFIIRTVKNTINGIKEFFVGLFNFANEIPVPEWLKDFGGWVWEKIKTPFNTILEVFNSINNLDLGKIVKEKIKSVPGGEWLYDKIWGEEEKAQAAAQASAKNLASVGVDQTIATSVALAQQKTITTRASEDEQEDLAELYEKRIRKSVGDKKTMSSGQLDVLAKALANDVEAQNTKLGKEILKITGGTFDSANKKHREILAKQMAKMHDSELMGDDVDDDYDESIEALSKAAGKQIARMRVDDDTVSALVDNIKKTGEVNLGGQVLKLDGSTQVTESMADEYKKLQQKQSTMEDGEAKRALTQYLKALEQVGVGKMLEQNRDQKQPTIVSKAKLTEDLDPKMVKLREMQKQYPDAKNLNDLQRADHKQALELQKMWSNRRDQVFSFNTKWKIDRMMKQQPVGLTSDIPDLDTDQASKDLNKAGDSLNKGARQISDTVGDQFPRPNSPYAWEYLRMAGENINSGSRRLYEQSIEYDKSANLSGKQGDKNNNDMSEKMTQMVVVLTETAEIQKKTLQILSDNGLTEKTGETVVNNGGNTTNISNITVDSDIMSFRDRVVGRLYSK